MLIRVYQFTILNTITLNYQIQNMFIDRLSLPCVILKLVKEFMLLFVNGASLSDLTADENKVFL